MLIEGLIEQQIATFVRSHVCHPNSEYGRCVKLVVRHLTVDKKPQGDVATIKIQDDPAFEGTEAADRVVMEIADACQTDANDARAGVQVYAVYAYFAKGNFTPRKIFRVSAEEDFDRDVGPSEPPTEKGITQMLMRHLETNSKNSLVAMGYIISTLQKENQQQREANHAYQQQQFETTLLLQDLMNESHKRRIEEKREDMINSVFEGTFEHLKIAIPILINKFAGKEITPEKVDKNTYLLAAFLENLTPEQQSWLRDKMAPHQLVILSELLENYEKSKEKQSVDKNGNSSSVSSSLVKMFEKRKNLVNADEDIVEDARSKRIEEKAKKIRELNEKAIESLSTKPK